MNVKNQGNDLLTIGGAHSPSTGVVCEFRNWSKTRNNIFGDLFLWVRDERVLFAGNRKVQSERSYNFKGAVTPIWRGSFKDVAN
jgi:hypothetical protein